MKLDFPPVNDFIPVAENIIMKKKTRVEDKSSSPVLLKTNSNLELWHKQDDTFDQPFVNIKMRITTTDC